MHLSLRLSLSFVDSFVLAERAGIKKKYQLVVERAETSSSEVSAHHLMSWNIHVPIKILKKHSKTKTTCVFFKNINHMCFLQETCTVLAVLGTEAETETDTFSSHHDLVQI